MTKYLLLYSGGKMPETEAESAQVIQAWTAWYTGLGSAVVDPGNPFTPAAASIASNGAVGAVAAAGMASGYSIIQAESLDAAVGKAKGCPVIQAGGQISVFETFEIM
jgi:hypothetical protein